MIVFVDGVDGSGKTTLIDGLLKALAAQGKPAVIAPPLWTFIDRISEPSDFAPWVMATPGVDVQRHLLQAMARRLSKLLADLHLGVLDADATVLVDRGPKTVVCSALGHALTGPPPDDLAPGGRLPGPEIWEQALDREVASLAVVSLVGAVELRAVVPERHDADIIPIPDFILARLTRTEEMTTVYRRYLDSFNREMTITAWWPGMPWLGLDAAAAVATNVARSLVWIASARP